MLRLDEEAEPAIAIPPNRADQFAKADRLDHFPAGTRWIECRGLGCCRLVEQGEEIEPGVGNRATYCSLGLGLGGFAPVVEGTVLPHHPFDPVGPPESADVPVIISTTLEDAALALTNFDLDDAGLKAILNKRFGPKGDEIYALYHKSSWNSKKSPYLIQAQILTDNGFRRGAITQAERKAAQGKAPAYMYLWAYESPGFGGKFGAVHGTDVSASFYNYRDGIGGTGSPPQKALWTQFASAWVAFAKTGDPNNPKIPNWPAYELTKRATMVFDKDPRVENDPRGEIRKFWDQMPPRPAHWAEAKSHHLDSLAERTIGSVATLTVLTFVFLDWDATTMNFSNLFFKPRRK